MVRRGQRVAFLLAGQDRWVIDPRRFGGHARIALDESPNAIRIELIDALFPGTTLPADFICELTPRLVGWWMRLQLKLGDLTISVPFERWLAGIVPAVSSLQSSVQGVLGPGADIELVSGASAEFRSDWSLRLEGQRAATLQFRQHRLPAVKAELSLLGTEGSSLLDPMPARRTVVSIGRDENRWNLTETIPKPPFGHLGGKGAFDVIHLETGVDSQGSHSGALAALSGDASTLYFEPGRGLQAATGEVFRLALQQAHYMAALDESDAETAFTARFGTEPVHLQSDGCLVELGDSAVPFQIEGQGEQFRSIRCEPALLGVAAPLTGGSAAPLRPRMLATMAFVGSDEQTQVRQVNPRVLRPVSTPEEEEEVKTERAQPQPRTLQRKVAPVQTGKVQIDRGQISRIRFPTHLSVSVVRPQDLLALEFEFVNLRLETSGTSPQLVRSNSSKAAYLIVHFQPQSIAEEAFFEAANEFEMESGQDEETVRPDDPDKQKQATKTSDVLPTPPVRARLSGPSRLVFRVPQATEMLDYTLADLLAACSSFPLQVSANAKPPVKPRRFVYTEQLARLATPSKVQRTISTAAPAEIGAVEMDLRRTPTRTQPGRNVAGIARVPGGIKLIQLPPSKPGATQTAIEMPYRLILSPHWDSAWAHSTSAVQGTSGRYELWHTRLGVRDDEGGVDEADTFYRTVRAIWSPDYHPEAPPIHFGGSPPDPEGNPFRTSLDSRDRHEIVAETSDFSGLLRVPPVGPPGPYTPLPVSVDNMMLTTLGAWLDSRGAWEPPVDPKTSQDASGTTYSAPGMALEVEEWRHRATMARDHYVKVVYKGFLLPVRNRASLIKVTERKFQKIQQGKQAGKYVAILRQRMYIIVREPEVTYDYSSVPASEREEFKRLNPFKRIRITSLVTPSLDKPEDDAVDEKAQQAFWPKVGQNDFLFHLVGWDWRGERCDFTAPLMFVGAGLAGEKSWLPTAIRHYSPKDDAEKQQEGFTTAREARRTRPFNGQKIAFAAAGQPGPDGASPDNTTLETAAMTFTAVIPGNDPAKGWPHWFPALVESQVKIPAAAAIAGNGAVSRIEYSPIYLDHGFPASAAANHPNLSEIFVQIKGDSGTPLNFSADQSGGIATPNLSIAGLSRRFGPVGGPFSSPPDLSNLAAGNYDPKDFFEGAAARILGAIDLWDILEVAFGGGKNVPKLSTTVVFPKDTQGNPDETKLPEAYRADLVWQPDVKSDPLGIYNPHLNELPQSGKPEEIVPLYMKGEVITRIDPMGGNVSEPEFKIVGRLNKFDVNLIAPVMSFLVINFDYFRFESGGGKKMDVDPKIGTVEFAGPLKFINELKDYIPMGGSNIDVTPEGVKFGYTLGLPAITAGVMNLQNISLSAGLHIPFSGDPVRVRFAFCERDNPFLLTVYCFGGGGFFGLAIGVDGVEVFEVSLEFGAAIALDLGVASGGVSVMAGIYMKIESDACSLTGYVRLNGALEIMAIITLSIEFYLGLTWEDGDPDKVWGEARVRVEIEILFVSVGVEMTVRREFADPDLPKFIDMMGKPQWDEYCDAFAA